MNDALHVLLAQAGLESLNGGPLPLTYALAALLCACLGRSASLAQRTSRPLQRLWRWLGPLYLLVAASCLLQGDLLWVRWARDFARSQQLYGERRFWQLSTLLVLAWLAAAAWGRLQRARAQSGAASRLYSMVVAGAGVTLGLYLLRYVSFHYTDQALNAYWLGHSLGTWVECAALALAATGTTSELLRSQGHV